MNFQDIISTQRTFFQSHKTKDLKFRRIQLELLNSTLKKNENLLYEALEKDLGKSRFDTYATELSMVYSELGYYLKNLRSLSQPKRVRTNLANLPGQSRIYLEPLGSVLVMAPWNYPLQLSLCPAIAALAAGNTVILKPSEHAPHTMALLTSLINSTFSSHSFYCAKGGQEVASELLKYKWDKIFFTGSTKVGKIVYEAAAKHLTPVTLELGGKSPAIVTRSADLKTAAKRIVWGKFLNAGQTCVAPDYVLIDSAIESEFLSHVTHYLKKFRYEAQSTHYAKIVTPSHFERLEGLLEGEDPYYGGNRNKETLYFEPTVIRGVTRESPLMQEEIFGPILPILSYSSFSQALQSVLHDEKPLAAYLFSNRNVEKEAFLTQLSFGGGCINDVVMHLTNPSLPFGGVGSSGMGSYHGEKGFLTFSHEKSILKRTTWGEPSIKYPPYSKSKLKWIKRLMSI
ncbi:aldehyde dehydrogenase family protein [Chryseobacterium sp. A301]